MVIPDDTQDYNDITDRLDQLGHVPTEVLNTVVVRRGLCLWGLWPAQEPDWEDCAPSDRELAARLCAGCPVIDQCLEVELRTTGMSTTGVWGAMAEGHRRALHPIWRQRRQQEPTDHEGGPTP